MNLNNLLKILQIIVYIVTIVGVSYTAYSVQISIENLELNKGKIAYDADKSKKEFAINALQNIDNFDIGLSCISLISDLSESEIIAIFNYNPSDISAPHILKLRGCLAGQNETVLFNFKNNKLTNIGSYYIRTKVLSTLNKLEIYVAASCNDIFDKKILNMFLSNLQEPYFKVAIAKIRGLVNYKGYGYLEAYITDQENPC